MSKVMVVGPAWVGDMVMAHTLFQLLKQNDPKLILHVLAPAWAQPLLARMPEVNEVSVMPLKHGEFQLWKRYQLGRQWAKNAYEQAIVLPNSFKSALIPFFAGIPRRTGWRGEYRFGLLNDCRRLDKTRYPLMIERFSALAFSEGEPLPSLPFPVLSADPVKVRNLLEKFKLNLEKPVLILCPGAEFGISKRWPSLHYAKVAKIKLEEGWQVWLLGSEGERVQAQRIQEATEHQCHDFVGQTDLDEVVDLLSLGSKVVSNDSGLMHIAAALKRPLVVVYGSTNPAFTPPLNFSAKTVSLKLDCRPCFKRVCPLQHFDCMNKLSPELVLQALSDE